MISEEQLRIAAEAYNQAWVAAAELGYNPAEQHVFSSKFERKIRRLKRRADHPLFHRFLRSAAALLLSLLVGGCTWLAVDAEARSAFVGWVKEILEEHFVFHFEDDTEETGRSSGTETIQYRPTWLPKGYWEYSTDELGGTVSILYVDESANVLAFRYIHSPNKTDWFMEVSQASITDTTVNSYPAELFLPQSPDIAQAITWSNENNTAFFISGHLDKDELIQIAESVKIFP